MTKQEFAFIIGYQGAIALIDKEFYNKFKNKNVAELLQLGLYKPAFAMAFFEDNQEEMKQVLETYNSLSKRDYKDPLILKRVFGVEKSSVKKIKMI